MYDRKQALQLLFAEIIRLSHRTDMMAEAIAGGGYSLHGLVDSIVGPFGRNLVDKIVEDKTGESHEFRLNEAGFKLYWRLDQEHDLLKLRIGGDQASNYPCFTATIKLSIRWSNIR
jgi:hypothetical protein